MCNGIENDSARPLIEVKTDLIAGDCISRVGIDVNDPTLDDIIKLAVGTLFINQRTVWKVVHSDVGTSAYYIEEPAFCVVRVCPLLAVGTDGEPIRGCEWQIIKWAYAGKFEVQNDSEADHHCGAQEEGDNKFYEYTSRFAERYRNLTRAMMFADILQFRCLYASLDDERQTVIANRVVKHDVIPDSIKNLVSLPNEARIVVCCTTGRTQCAVPNESNPPRVDPLDLIRCPECGSTAHLPHLHDNEKKEDKP